MEIETGAAMDNMITGLLILFAFMSMLADLPVAGAVFGVLTLAWCAVFETPFGR